MKFKITDTQPVALVATISTAIKAVIAALVALGVVDKVTGAELIGGETVIAAAMAVWVRGQVTSPATIATSYIPRIQIPEAPPPQDVMQLPVQPPQGPAA